MPSPPVSASTASLEEGDDLVISSWDIIGGRAKAAENVLLYDDSGGHQGMTAAEMIANSDADLELVSPERYFAPEVGGLNHVPYMKTFHTKGVRITINTRLASVRRDGNALVATLVSDFAEGWREQRRVDQVVVEHGTAPMDGIYFDLKPLSKNRGAVNYDTLVNGGDIFPLTDPNAAFILYRIGDAVAAARWHERDHATLCRRPAEADGRVPRESNESSRDLQGRGWACARSSARGDSALSLWYRPG